MRRDGAQGEDKLIEQWFSIPLFCTNLAGM